MPTIEVNMPTLYPKQMAAFFNPARYSVVEASTKAGKTLGCLVWQGTQVMKDKAKRNHWWVAPTYSQAAIAYRRARKMYGPRRKMVKEGDYFVEQLLPGGLCVPHDGEMRLTFKNGAEWWFKTGEKPDNLYGEDVASAVVDEFTRVREDAWHAIRSTLTYTRGQVRLIGNVKGRANWGYKLARKAQDGADGMAYHKIVASDAVAAGVLDQAEIDNAKAVLPEAVYRELFECIPADDGGNPFGLDAIRRQVRQLSLMTPVAFGIDLAKSHDWTVVVGLDAAGEVCTLERWQGDWGQTRARILAMVNGWPVLIDSTGVGDPIVEDLTKVRSNIQGFRFSSSSKQQLMEGLASAIHTGEVGYPEGWLTTELETFEYEYTRTGVRYTAPAGLHDDGVCALALAVKCRRDQGGAWCGVVQLDHNNYLDDDDD